MLGHLITRERRERESELRNDARERERARELLTAAEMNERSESAGAAKNNGYRGKRACVCV